MHLNRRALARCSNISTLIATGDSWLFRAIDCRWRHTVCSSHHSHRLQYSSVPVNVRMMSVCVYNEVELRCSRGLAKCVSARCCLKCSVPRRPRPLLQSTPDTAFLILICARICKCAHISMSPSIVYWIGLTLMSRVRETTVRRP